VDIFAKDASTQVTLEAAIVDVTLGNEFQYGIDWSRVVPLSGAVNGSAAIKLGSRDVVDSPALTANITTSSVKSVIKHCRIALSRT
jgi:type II secretory pathway component GspD/PulD (secretin)